MVPPGGVDAFVDDVMQPGARARRGDARSPRRTWSRWPRRLAMAATVAVAVIRRDAGLSLRQRPCSAPEPIQRAARHSDNAHDETGRRNV